MTQTDFFSFCCIPAICMIYTLSISRASAEHQSNLENESVNVDKIGLAPENTITVFIVHISDIL